MAEFNGKLIFECTSDVGNTPRRQYYDSINNFLERKFEESHKVRDNFMKDIVSKQEDYRKLYLEMIVQPVNPYPEEIPAAKVNFVGKDEFGDSVPPPPC